MILVLSVLLILVTLIGIKPRREGPDGALSMEQTNAVRGIFAVIILLSHMRQYVAFGAIDNIPLKGIEFLGQSMVAPFLFFSGYGIAYSYEKKDGYEKHFLKNRFLKLWVHFALAVALYFGLNMLLGTAYPIKTVLLSFTGWEAIGNSNWYVFDTFVLYLFAFIAFMLTKLLYRRKSVRFSGCIVVVLTVALAIFLRIFKGEATWWYDTVFCFAFGWWFFVFRDRIFKALRKKSVYYPVLVLTLIGLVVLHHFYRGVYEYNILACIFVFLTVLITAKLRIVNPVLTWLGKHSFQIYILMRLPMNFLLNKGYNTNEWFFCSVSAVVTLIISFGALEAEKLIDKLLFSKRKA